MSTAIKTVLFDLDGTLADTAPDLANALNQVRGEQGMEPLPYPEIRQVVSHGGIALIRLGFAMEPDHPGFKPLHQRLLAIYRDTIANQTRLFDGMERLIDEIEARTLNWGVVTNKPSWLTDPLMEQLGLTKRASTIISGDTLDERKPHPAPMLYACRQAGSSAMECIYVGDAARDIEAGKNAGMKTLVALFGYIGDDERPEDWGADGMVENPLEILNYLETV